MTKLRRYIPGVLVTALLGASGFCGWWFDWSYHPSARAHPRSGLDWHVPPGRLDKPEPQWFALHQHFKQEVKQKNPDIVFIGDSITFNWTQKGYGKPVWDAYYTKNAYAMGITGDTTQNLLWRIRDGELSGIHPKLVFIMIGANNLSQGTTPDDTYYGVVAVARAVHHVLPHSEVVLLGILPFSEAQWPPIVRQINARLAAYPWPARVHFHDIGDVLLNDRGNYKRGVIDAKLMHPTTRGYGLLHEKLQPITRLYMSGNK